MFGSLNKDVEESYCEGEITFPLLSALGDTAFLILRQAKNLGALTELTHT